MSAKQSPEVQIPRRRSSKVDADHPVYELDIWLHESDPPIYRSVAVPADLTLAELHYVIQGVMDWDEAHLHAFQTKDGRRFEAKPEGPQSADPFWAMLPKARPPQSEAQATLRSLFTELKEMLAYEYDFGDSWIHGIKLIRTHPDAAAFAQMPICLAGGERAPMEDSGGLWGWYDKLAIASDPDPNDNWHQEVLEWLGIEAGESFDAHSFDPDAANRAIRDISPPPK